jgi:type IV secretory pathway VirB3-like protein
MSTSLPHTNPSDDRAGVETLFAGIAIPYVVAVLMICLGLVVGGTLGMAIAYGSLLLLVIGVLMGIVAFIRTDEDEES